MSGSSDSIDYDDYFRKEGNSKRAECIRNRTNFTVPKSFHLVDKKDFNPDMLNLYIKNDASPKLKLLLNKIPVDLESMLKTLTLTETESKVWPVVGMERKREREKERERKRERECVCLQCLLKYISFVRAILD